MKIILLKLTISLLLFSSCSSDKSTQIDSSNLKVMTFNIRNGKAKDGENHWTKRRHMVYKMVNEYNSDFIGMQEAFKFQLDDILASCKQYSSVGEGRDGKGLGEYSNILYKKDKYELLETETFWLSSTPEVVSKSWGNWHHRICTWGLFKNKINGKKVYVFNTHFDHKSVPARIKSARLIIDRVKNRKQKDTPFVIMGDFNAVPSSMEMNYFTSNNLLDADVFIAHKDLNRGTATGFKFGNYKRKIDHIFISEKQWKVLDSKIIRYSENKRYPSDHFPVYAELELKN